MTCKSQRYCSGCRDNFYNGNNGLGVTECWSLKTAEVVTKKFVHVDARPPWKQRPEKTYSCHRRERHIAVDPKVTQ
jgi:hypothetical protein